MLLFAGAVLGWTFGACFHLCRSCDPHLMAIVTLIAARQRSSEIHAMLANLVMVHGIFCQDSGCTVLTVPVAMIIVAVSRRVTVTMTLPTTVPITVIVPVPFTVIVPVPFTVSLRYAGGV